ncbi:MAG: TonB-dependent Receptor Plug Domain protein [Mucilaginibacter sp.]|nr:TonB-dependent Receptor Plug Domain protein [Mucilaginibacter sp.]
MGKFLRIVLLFISLLACSGAMAQNQGTVIKGTVSDDRGVTLPGATVKVKGTQIGVVTDANGHYSINVPPTGKTLVFSFIGTETREVVIGSKTTIDVTLSLTSTALTDVVVIGYGTQKRGDVNGSIASIGAKDILDLPQPSIDQMLQGKAAGVTITQNSGEPGSATSVHIRGISGFGASEPLYVIDGVEKQGSGGGGQLTRPGGGQEETTVSALALINPNDIESIDILKDASASAIYGSRAANGVIIITTKRGKNGTARVNYDGYVGLQQQGKFIPMMNLPQYASLQNRLAVAFGIQPRAEFADPSVLGPGTNWQDAIFRTAAEQSHNLSVSGGSDKSDYYVSAGYFKQDGTILGYNFDRYTFRGSLNSQAKTWLKMGSTFSGSRSDQNVGLGSNTGIIYNALLASPDQAVYNADGSYAGPYVTTQGTVEGGPNPVQQALNISNTLNRNNINGNLYAEIKFFKDLSLRSEVDGDFNWTNAQTFNPSYDYAATGVPDLYHIKNPTATLNRLMTNSTYWSWKEYFNYGHTWGKSNLTALAGREVWESTYDQVPLSGTGFVAGNNVQSIALANSVGASVAEFKQSTVMESYLARAIFTYNNKYSLTANIRSDRSSNFAPGHQTGYFPGIAVSWRLSDEAFMAGVKSFADNIKIRASYGTVGNSNVPNYVYGASLKAVATAFGTGFIINNVANPNLTWQTSIQKDIGIDFSILNNRVEATIDYYNKTNNKFLFQQPLPNFLVGGGNEYGDNPAGIAPPYINAGEIENKGIEISINSRNIVTKDFTWATTLTFSHYNNKVVSLNNAPAINQSINTSFISLAATSTIPGYPVGEFYGYKVQGVVKTPAQLQYLATHPQNVTGTSPQVVTNDPTVSNSIWLGDLQYQDTNGDGKVDVNDRVPLGNPNPDFTYGFTNTFNYKGIDLSIFFYGSYGGKILNALEYQTAGLSGLYQNQLASSANFWTPTNPNSNIPAPRGGLGNPNLVMSDRFLESASFLRLQNVRLGYNLPARWAKYVAMNSLKVYVSGQNLFVITKYPGLDPEVGSFNQSPTLMNIDLGRYPSPRVFTLGINAQF